MLIDLVHQHRSVTDNGTDQRQSACLRHDTHRRIEQEQAQNNANQSQGCYTGNYEYFPYIHQHEHQQDDHDNEHSRHRPQNGSKGLDALFRRSVDFNFYAQWQLFPQFFRSEPDFIGDVIAGDAVNNTRIDRDRRQQITPPDHAVFILITQVRYLVQLHGAPGSRDAHGSQVADVLMVFRLQTEHHVNGLVAFIILADAVTADFCVQGSRHGFPGQAHLAQLVIVQFHFNGRSLFHPVKINYGNVLIGHHNLF